MKYYISPETVLQSFQRLKPKENKGKTNSERTSSLFYFIAFDMLSKEKGSELLDFNYQTFEGIGNRRRLAVNFSKLSLLQKHSTLELRQICALGEITTGGKDPEKRISSNFLTTILKKSTLEIEESSYPHRPAPLLSIGKIGDRFNWGIKRHVDWRKNIPKFLNERCGNTPFTDLSIIICRSDYFEKDEKLSWKNVLSLILKNKLTTPFADFLIRKIESESIFSKHIDENSFFLRGL